MELFFSLLALVGMGYGSFKGIKWLSCVGKSPDSKMPSLTPNDLKVLEESAARLVADIVTTTNECVAKIERVCAEASLKIERLEALQANLDSYNYSMPHTTQNEDIQNSGLSAGEVELLRGLQSIKGA